LKKRLNQLLFSLSLLILVLFFNSCGKSPKEYNNFYFQGKEEKNLNLLQKGFENPGVRGIMKPEKPKGWIV